MPKKILIATGLYPPESGGPATYTKLVEEKLPPRGFTVTVLPFSRVRHLPKVLRHMVYFLYCLRDARGVDMVYAQDAVSVGLPAWCAAACMGKKFVARIGGDYAWEQARQRFGVQDEIDEFQHKSYGVRVALLRAVQRFVLRRAAAVVLPSAYLERIVRGWGISHTRVIYSSIDIPAPAAIERPEGFLVVSSGRRVPWKGFEALERVVAREKGWQLFIASELPLPEALGWMKTADVYVLNSTYEGLSHQLVEAMALGVPVVATRVGGNSEVVGDAGLLVPAKDDEALYHAIKNVHDDRVAASARVAQGLARARLFSIDTTIKQLVELLHTV